MSHLRKLADWDADGYDGARKLQILPIARRTIFYLVVGDGLNVNVDDNSLVGVTTGDTDDQGVHKSAKLTDWEKEQVIRKITLTGKAVGDTQLRARLNGLDWIEPVTISVVSDQNWRCVGKATGETTSAMRQQLQSLPLRDAVLRVAEDQMHSAIASRSDGFGVYDPNPKYDWCGSFAYWCWNQAAAIKNARNPFGADLDVLRSPQKAVGWAMREDTPAQLLRYNGANPMTGSGSQEYREVGWNGNQLEPADIVLLREAGAKGVGWKHVCMVYRVGSSNIRTIDGNQGKFQSIKVVNRNLSDKLPDGSWKLVFVHLTI